MSASDFQNALTAMTLNVPLARRVKHEGSSALDAYALTSRELARLVRISRQAGMALNCTLARANRLTSICDAFPMTCVVLRPWLRDLLDTLWSAESPADYQLRGEVENFARCVERDWLPRKIEYLEEVFEYEKACHALLSASREVQLSDMKGRVRRVHFSHDPARVLPPLNDATPPPPELPIAPHWLEVEIVDDALETRWQPISASGRACAPRL
jgi:hypothetical protein